MARRASMARLGATADALISVCTQEAGNKPHDEPLGENGESAQIESRRCEA